MANLIIIGNGFDLAHGLKTDYKSFLKSLVLKCIAGYATKSWTIS
jgi:hypothetical protein